MGDIFAAALALATLAMGAKAFIPRYLLGFTTKYQFLEVINILPQDLCYPGFFIGVFLLWVIIKNK